MRLVLGLLFSLAVAACVGLGTTWLVLTRGTAFGAIPIGAWVAWPKSGTRDVDPYTRATFARTDDNGRPLDGRCDVLVSGTTPQARFWTITLYDPQGKLIGNSVDRQGFTSQEVVRRSDGSFDVTVAPRIRSGNWLPTNGIESYVLVLRLYDSPVGVATRAAREAPMPSVTVQSCP